MNRLQGLFQQEQESAYQRTEPDIGVITEINMWRAIAQERGDDEMLATWDELADKAIQVLCSLRFWNEDCRHLHPKDLPLQVAEAALEAGPESIPGIMLHEGVVYRWDRRDPGDFPEGYEPEDGEQ